MASTAPPQQSLQLSAVEPPASSQTSVRDKGTASVSLIKSVRTRVRSSTVDNAVHNGGGIHRPVKPRGQQQEQQQEQQQLKRQQEQQAQQDRSKQQRNAKFMKRGRGKNHVEPSSLFSSTSRSDMPNLEQNLMQGRDISDILSVTDESYFSQVTDTSAMIPSSDPIQGNGKTSDFGISFSKSHPSSVEFSTGDSSQDKYETSSSAVDAPTRKAVSSAVGGNLHTVSEISPAARISTRNTDATTSNAAEVFFTAAPVAAGGRKMLRKSASAITLSKLSVAAQPSEQPQAGSDTLHTNSSGMAATLKKSHSNISLTLLSTLRAPMVQSLTTKIHRNDFTSSAKSTTDAPQTSFVSNLASNPRNVSDTGRIQASPLEQRPHSNAINTAGVHEVLQADNSNVQLSNQGHYHTSDHQQNLKYDDRSLHKQVKAADAAPVTPNASHPATPMAGSPEMPRSEAAPLTPKNWSSGAVNNMAVDNQSPLPSHTLEQLQDSSRPNSASKESLKTPITSLPTSDYPWENSTSPPFVSPPPISSSTTNTVATANVTNTPSAPATSAFGSSSNRSDNILTSLAVTGTTSDHSDVVGTSSTPSVPGATSRTSTDAASAAVSVPQPDERDKLLLVGTTEPVDVPLPTVQEQDLVSSVSSTASTDLTRRLSTSSSSSRTKTKYLKGKEKQHKSTGHPLVHTHISTPSSTAPVHAHVHAVSDPHHHALKYVTPPSVRSSRRASASGEDYEHLDHFESLPFASKKKNAEFHDIFGVRAMQERRRTSSGSVSPGAPGTPPGTSSNTPTIVANSEPVDAIANDAPETPLPTGNGAGPTSINGTPAQPSREFEGGAVSDDEWLVEDFSCALQDTILLQGRMYLTEQHICFYCNILGYTRTVSAIERKNIALLIPNSIQITTVSGEKYFFASFLFREYAHSLLTRLWRLSHPRHVTGAASNTFASLMTPRLERLRSKSDVHYVTNSGADSGGESGAFDTPLSTSVPTGALRSRSTLQRGSQSYVDNFTTTARAHPSALGSIQGSQSFTVGMSPATSEARKGVTSAPDNDKFKSKSNKGGLQSADGIPKSGSSSNLAIQQHQQQLQQPQLQQQQQQLQTQSESVDVKSVSTCKCLSELHGGNNGWTQVVDTEIAGVTPQEILRAVYASPPLRSEFAQADFYAKIRRCIDIDTAHWMREGGEPRGDDKDGSAGFRDAVNPIYRDVAFKTPVNAPIGPKMAHVQGWETIRHASLPNAAGEPTIPQIPASDNRGFCVLSCTQAANVPSGRDFRTLNCVSFFGTSNGGTRMVVSVKTSFLKSIWIRGVVEKTGIETARSIYSDFAKWIGALAKQTASSRASGASASASVADSRENLASPAASARRRRHRGGSHSRRSSMHSNIMHPLGGPVPGANATGSASSNTTAGTDRGAAAVKMLLDAATTAKQVLEPLLGHVRAMLAGPHAVFVLGMLMIVLLAVTIANALLIYKIRALADAITDFEHQLHEALRQAGITTDRTSTVVMDAAETSTPTRGLLGINFGF